jgi:cytidine deaminase
MPELIVALVEDFLTRVGNLYPIEERDWALRDAARKAIEGSYQQDFHHLAAAARGWRQETYTALQTDCKIGQASVCAEAMVLAKAEEAGDGLETIIAIHHGHTQGWRVVAPCAMCLERLWQFAPDVKVIVPRETDWNSEGLAKLPVTALYTLPYARRVRSGPPIQMVRERASREHARF